MTVAGQPQVTYGFNSDNELSSITQSSSVVSLGFDHADRLTTTTLPNNVIETYGYDDPGADIASITAKLGATTLSALQYTFDGSAREDSGYGTSAGPTFPPPSARPRTMRQASSRSGEPRTLPTPRPPDRVPRRSCVPSLVARQSHGPGGVAGRLRTSDGAHRCRRAGAPSLEAAAVKCGGPTLLSRIGDRVEEGRACLSGSSSGSTRTKATGS
jgi:YD repeat-containing protein